MAESWAQIAAHFGGLAGAAGTTPFSAAAASIGAVAQYVDHVSLPVVCIRGFR